MATFGRTAKGAVADSGYEGYKAASRYSLTAHADLSQLAAWLNISGAAVTARAMVYADNAGAPGALLAASADVVIPAGSSQLVTFPLDVELWPGDYWLTIGFDSAGGGSVAVWCEPSGTGSHVYHFGSAADATFGTPTTAGSAGDIDVSATYSLHVPAPVTAPSRGESTAALVLVDLEGNAKAFLEPDDISVTRRWCGGASLAATLDVRDPKVASIIVASRAVKFYLDGELRLHGKVGEPLQSDQDNVQLVAGDPWDELVARKLTADEVYTAQDGAAIAWAGIDAENARATTRIRQGSLAATALRTITFTAGTSRADQVTQLSQLEGSFGFSLDPVDNVPGTLAEFNALAGFNRGELPGVRFEYGDGTLANCSAFQESISRPRNRVVAQGQSLPDGTRPEAVAEDTASQDEYGLWEYVVSVDSTDTDVLQAHANAELRPAPVAVYSLTPNADAPLLFRDFDAGHVVGLAIRHGRVDVVGTARVDECTIRRGSADGGWVIDSLTLSSESVQRVAQGRDERLTTLLGSWRDRVARLERARVVGS